jgi:murein DD-endopeptidase MepM/ murein hydrolase activator NlpD
LRKLGLILLVVGVWCVGCTRSANHATPVWQRAVPTSISGSTPQVTVNPLVGRRVVPTPDLPHHLPSVRNEPETYVVQPGDSLALIAMRYNVTVEQLSEVNGISDPNLLAVGQVLTIPLAPQGSTGPDFKIIPDSELVFGPPSAHFALDDFIRRQNGRLAEYSEVVDERVLSGAQIVERVARENSVSPRLLLALLEYQSGWVTQRGEGDDFPLGFRNAWYAGLYRQLSWAANNLCRGYYLWRMDAVSGWLLADGTLVPPSPTINAGTAGVQYFFSLLYGEADWQRAVSEQGLFATFEGLFGYPFDLAFEPLLPANLQQPVLQLPFAKGETWSFTGGPHGGWADGTAWAALDFAPPGEPQGCVVSANWVTAVADGLVTYAADGVVILDLDGDGFEQTGWSIFYLHIDADQRVSAGTSVRAGDRLGHPSCEGGVSKATHVHIARRYNGEWISADGALPFVMDGWVAQSAGTAYDGTLVRGAEIIEAWDRFVPENQIRH